MKKAISIIFYLLAVVFLLTYVWSEIMPNLMLSETGRLFLLGGSCLFLYVGGLIKSKAENNNKPMKINLWIFFILYLVLLITLTLFDPMWGRNGFNAFNWTQEGLDIYLENSVNLVPFKTIIGYAKKIFTSLLSTSTIFLNLFGNIVCLMPLALFIPMLFKKIDNTKKFLISILCVTLGIELIQFITFTGSCDIDDIILNTLGAFIMYKILNIKDVNNLVRNILLLEKNDVNKKKIIIVIIPLIIVCVLILGLYKIGKSHYNENLDEWTSKRNYQIEIIDESESNDQTLELFYETELYEYYFEGPKSDSVYAIINGNEKYLVKDLLNNNPTDYVIFFNRLERAGLEFIKKEKYPKMEVNIKGNVYLDDVTISDENIFEIGYGDQSQEENELTLELYIIPKQKGKADLTLNFGNTVKENDIVEKREYTITVDENLEVKYEEKDKFDVGAKIETIIRNGDKTSSNPYDYINASKKEYNELLEHSKETFEYSIKDLIDTNASKGLVSYIEAILCSEINKDFQYDFSSPNDYLEKYKEYLKNTNQN